MPTGEWWIDSCGTAIFADGDIGDINHEAYVIDLVVHEVLGILDIDIDDEICGTLEGDLVSRITKDHLPDGITYNEDEDEIYEDGESVGDFYDWVKKEIQECGYYDADKASAVYDTCRGAMDARVFGIQHMGMYRVHGTYIQTWTLTKEDLRKILEGLHDAHYDLDERGANIEWYIEVSSSKRYYSGIPYSVLMKGNLLSIAAYREVA